MLINKNPTRQLFSVNGVPYPLDEYRKLIGLPTSEEIAKYCVLWGKFGKENK